MTEKKEQGKENPNQPSCLEVNCSLLAFAFLGKVLSWEGGGEYGLKMAFCFEILYFVNDAWEAKAFELGFFFFKQNRESVMQFDNSGLGEMSQASVKITAEE